MKAMIFAAGLGTRLKPMTDSMPKALVPVAGRPLLWHVLEKLRRSGADEAVVNVHHFAPMICKWLADNNMGIKVEISDESGCLLDTGGGILKAEPLLRGRGGFLAHNVDILSNLDIRAFEAAVRPDDLATLVVSDRPTSRYLLFDGEMRMVGWTNVTTGEVRSPFGDIDPSRCRKLAFAGIHRISDGIFDAFRRYGLEGKFSITDFYVRACADHPVRGYVQPGFRMLDVGKTDTLAAAEDFLKSMPEA